MLFGNLLFLLCFFFLLFFSFLSLRHERVHGQISGTTGQNFMKLGGVIDICFQLVLKLCGKGGKSHILRGSKGVGITIESYGILLYYNVDNF
jgi:hypothetical protein